MRSKSYFLATIAPIALSAALLMPAAASADSGSTLTVVGTSDVSDSGLFQNLIAPAFEAQYPQYQIHYVGTASGTAITDAETGAGASGGASVLLVHAASLENQFLANGYSYNNQPGYGVFRNDFVLAGPSADPAGVGANGANNVAQAFADIAIAGYNGGGAPLDTFVSRGGTPGTTVEEHAIWALAESAGLLPATVPVCVVSATDGGGETPVSNSIGFTNGAACSTLPGADQASNGLPTGAGLPSWYVVTGLTQGPNVQAANTCTVGTSGANTCYVLSDRGTYDYLASGTDPAGTIPNLKILTRNDSASAPGGQYALINYFHAYVINQATVQAKTGSSSISVNLPAAQDLVSLLSSAGFQSELGNYLVYTSSTGGLLDSGGAPFVGDAVPSISESGLSTSVNYGQPVTVTGTVANSEPGYPALSGQTVNIDEIEGGLPVSVATGTTNSSGGYSVTFTPSTSGQYEVATGQLTQVENSVLSPAFSDTLSPSTSPAATLTVIGTPASHTLSLGRVRITVKRHHTNGTLKVAGTLSPAPALKGATIKLLAYSIRTGREKQLGRVTIAPGSASARFTVSSGQLRAGGYVLQLEYIQSGQTTVYSGLKRVNVK